MLKTTLAKVLTVKAAAAAMAVTAAGGGLALAATNGALPSGADNTHGQSSAHATALPSAAAAAGAAAAGADADHGSAAPSPSLVGLCRAYAAGVHDNPGKALDNPAFGALIAAADGKDQVSDYCTDLLKDKPATGASANANNEPTERPTTHATPSHPAKPAPSSSDNPRVVPTRPAE
jgi:hypothetical protein